MTETEELYKDRRWLLDRCAKLQAEVDEWKAEAERSKWPKEAAQHYYELKAMQSEMLAEHDRRREHWWGRALYWLLRKTT